MDINRFIKTHFNSPIQILVLKVAIELLIFKYHNILALKLGFFNTENINFLVNKNNNAMKYPLRQPPH